jgi:type IV pilus assembly protein PilN
MIAIDLRPPEDVAASAAIRRARKLAIIIVVTAALAIALAHAALETVTVLTRRSLVRVDAELAALERPVAALRRLRQRQMALRQRLAVIAGLEARGGGPVRLLDALAVSASPRLWLTELTLVGGTLRLTGFADDDQTVADFLARLRGTGSLESIDLEEAGRDDHTPQARRFVVAGRLGEARCGRQDEGGKMREAR